MYEFLYGAPPFLADVYGETYRRISKVDIRFPEDKHVSEEAKDLISKLLVHRATKRMRMEDVAAHPFINKYCKNEEEATTRAVTVGPPTQTTAQ